MIILKEEMEEKLEDMISRYSQKCRDIKNKATTTESGTEQFTEMVEKYNRPNFDDEER